MKRTKIMKGNNGITLVALVVTIVVLLLLAGISLNLVLGKNGIISRAQEAKEITQNKYEKEQQDLADLDDEMFMGERISATPEDVLEGKTYYKENEKLSTGTMKNNEDKDVTINPGESYTIPEGYHSGEGTVTADGITDFTPGTATADNISEGKTAWVNGQKITGTGTDVKTAYTQGTTDSTKKLVREAIASLSIGTYGGPQKKTIDCTKYPGWESFTNENFSIVCSGINNGNSCVDVTWSPSWSYNASTGKVTFSGSMSYGSTNGYHTVNISLTGYIYYMK